MATPLIEVIETCEEDINRFRNELALIITQADEDGIRDAEEKAEIEHFETAIAQLEQFTKDKRAEFERNKSEWNGLSSKVSELAADFQTLVEWGEPELGLVEEYVGIMYANEEKSFFRDAINTYHSAQIAIDPIMEEYNRQSAAKLTYEEELIVTKQRINAAAQSPAADSGIIQRLDGLQSDIKDCGAMANERLFVGALAGLNATKEKLTAIEKSIVDNERAIELVHGAYTDLVKKYTDAKDQLARFPDLLDEVIEEFAQAAETFGTLIEEKKIDEAALVVGQADIGISATLEQIPAREAALQAELEKREHEEMLLRAERDALATELSATPPNGTLWKLYEWKEADNFDRIAADSEVENASVILGHPNNKKLSDYYKSHGELPAGTLVCVLDPTVKIFKMQYEGEDIYLTEDTLAKYTAENIKLMSAVATNLNTLFVNLEKNNKIAYDARHMGYWVTRYMTGWEKNEPAAQREKARASVQALQGTFSRETAEQFAMMTVTAAADCQAYKIALQTWLREMQIELKASMESLEFYDKAAKTVLVVAVVTVTSPASVPAAALYAGLTSAAISAGSDTIKIVGTAAVGGDAGISPKDVIANAIKAGLTTGLSALAFGGLFSKFGPLVATRISSLRVVQAQAGRLWANPAWNSKIFEMITKSDAGRALVERSGGTIAINKLVAPIIVEGYLKLFGRIAWGESVALRNYIIDAATSAMEDNPEILESPSEEAAAQSIANQVLDDATVNGMFDLILKEHEAELEAIIAEDISKIDLEKLE